jgi:hypothetical protein
MPTSFGKRDREKRLRERAEAKRQRRAERSEQTDPEPPDTDALMEQFRLVSEQYAAGAIDHDSYEAQRRAIFSELGMTDAFDDPS